MKASFELDPCHTLKIETVGNHREVDLGVLLTVTYQPGFSGHGSLETGFVDETPKGWTQKIHIPPSFARAIASSLLSAATEAK